jgi:hypothetical protein
MTAGISGHQELGDSATVAWIRAALGDVLTRKPLQLGLTSLAAGSDQLFASVLLERQIPFDVIIPCLHYDTTFNDITLPRYRELLAKARQQTTLAFPSPSEQAFWTAGRQIVDGSDFLIAIWDGQEARGLGGTGDVVSYALDAGHPVLHIDPIRRTTRSLRGA